MKIVIIGGGWVGCHLAYKLKDTHDITLFDKNNFLFEETSYKNQNRLHMGYHYSRNHMTREMCKNTFNRFTEDYSFLIKDVNNNFYCVPETSSVLDFNTYKQIFKIDEEKTVKELIKIEGCVNTDEKRIDFYAAKQFFNETLKDVFTTKTVSNKELKKLRKEYDLVIDCTNNHINKSSTDNFFELTLTLLYSKQRETSFDALTLVDGPLFSIYPYTDSIFTVTDVEHTPLKKVKTIKSVNNLLKDLSIDLLNNKRRLIEKKILYYYPDFLKDYEYFDYILSTKSKTTSSTDNRYPIIKSKGNLIQCFTGKIQGIYIIEDYIKKIIN